MVARAERIAGVLTSWNDERGFGFISPTTGGKAAFVHIKAFPQGSDRPRLGMSLTFDVEFTAEGKSRATRVRTPSPAAAGPFTRTDKNRRRGARKKFGARSYLAIVAFVAGYLVLDSFHPLPIWVAGCYAVMSLVCFFFYAADKSAAVAGRWRVSESTLLVLGLACGWPGAILAQQLFHHKTTKASFRSAFWASVITNVVIVGVLFLAVTTNFTSA
ncbi:cold shock and DUF1294 domain-containing protein [Cryobacterium sp. PH29-G1]|uniref:cold shock and DUF1294 domain-containing protein n=1 Tax=Cryobacterium sp. PH29-G1 TaxID=3046211 RepID=UPI0024B9A1E6|nr:cold shock and DUF1294 domain-containing protein [Cryobacterium sp. PH29-G1]MDJ0349079.1 cold shock and DUF1294 domain-containing protein [Cryobacterium sp. PH29-G1]